MLEYTGALGETHEGSWVTEQLKMSEGSWTSGVPSSAQDWSANLDSNCKHVMEVPALRGNWGASQIIRIVCIRASVSRRARIVQRVELPRCATIDNVHVGHGNVRSWNTVQ